MALPWQTRDGRLVDRVRSGDPQAFEQIYARYQPEILSFCRHLTGQREDAEDAVQHTFLSAYSQIVESEGEVELRPWLFTVARNRCLSLLRARGVRGAEPLTDSARSVDGLASEVERRQELRDLVADVGRLPEPQRAALLLSQMDSMSHREIGTVLGVAPEKVKALVFQARSSLLATREAREAPCSDVRSQLTTSRGGALRRRTLRRHLHECQGCREFEVAVRRQRHNLDVLLPVIPTAGLHRAVLDALATRDGASAAAGAGGAGAVAAGSTGASGGFGGSLIALGTQGVAKLAVVGVVATGGAAGAVAADLPAQIGGAAPADRHEAAARQDALAGGAHGAPEAGSGGSPGVSSPNVRRREDSGDRAQDEDWAGSDGATAPSGEPADSVPEGSDEETGGDGDLPPGLAKKDELPPGLAKKEGSAQGKKGKAPPGQAKKPAPASGGGQGNGGDNGNGNGQGQGNGGGGNGGGQGNGGAGGNGNGNGQGHGGGQGNGVGNGQGQGNGGGNGGGQDNGGSQGNGQGSGNGHGNGNGH